MPLVSSTPVVHVKRIDNAAVDLNWKLKIGLFV
jgi:hypothetical protein